MAIIKSIEMTDVKIKEIYSILTLTLINIVTYSQKGKIGIGVSEPAQKLSIDGAIQICMNEEAGVKTRRSRRYQSGRTGTVSWSVAKHGHHRRTG